MNYRTYRKSQYYTVNTNSKIESAVAVYFLKIKGSLTGIIKGNGKELGMQFALSRKQSI